MAHMYLIVIFDLFTDMQKTQHLKVIGTKLNARLKFYYTSFAEL
jgi:hypothetical protein